MVEKQMLEPYSLLRENCLLCYHLYSIMPKSHHFFVGCCPDDLYCFDLIYLHSALFLSLIFIYSPIILLKYQFIVKNILHNNHNKIQSYTK